MRPPISYEREIKTLCCDFDGVLNLYSGTFNPDEMPAPRPGAKEFVDTMTIIGYKVIVHTTRPRNLVVPWLQKHGFGDVEYSETKPVATVYLDDRAVCFEGNFKQALVDIASFKAHWEQ